MHSANSRTFRSEIDMGANCIPCVVPPALSDIPISRWCNYAATHNQLELLLWARSHGAPWDENVCAYAAKHGHLGILQWARNHGAPWDSSTCDWAAEYGHLEVLKWARANGAPWNVTCELAAANGVLQWARSHGASWNENTCLNAAAYGHLKTLRWAMEHGAPWDMWACAYAAKNGYLEILRWARENGAPWNETTCAFTMHSAVFARYNYDVLITLQWAIAHGAPLNSDDIKTYEENIISTDWRGVALALVRRNRVTPRINYCINRFIVKMTRVLPLTTPLCNMVINYC